MRPEMRHESRAARAQAVVIGAVVLFGFVVAALGVLQLGVLPAQVEAEELAHSDRVTGDLLAVGSSQWRAATVGEFATTDVAVGLDYRHRFLLMTPPPSRGHLALEPLGTLSVSNVALVEEPDAGDVLGPYPTSALTYTPGYARYDSAPTTVLESHVAYDRFEGGVEVVEGRWSFVDGNRVTLVAVTGSLSSSGRLTEPVTVVPVSAPASAVPITNATGEAVTIRVSTGLSNESWATVLAPEYVSNGGHVVAHSVADGVLTVVLEPGVEYDLRLARLGIGPGQTPPSEPATRVVAVEGTDRTVPPGGSQLLVVEARDRFNNPVAGVHVRADVTDADGTVRSTSRISGDPAVAVTDERGRASFVLTAEETAPAAAGNVTFVMTDAGG